MKIFNVARHDKNEILTNVFCSKGVLVGSSTMNNVMMPKVAGMLEELAGLRFRNKKASAFGSFGWNGGTVDRIQTRLMDCGFETTLALKTKWRPDRDNLEVCREHGRNIARQWALEALPEVAPTTPQAAPSVVENNAAEQDLGPCMQCSVCLWIYDPKEGEAMQDVAPGTRWEEVPDNFLCPECAMGKEVFDPIKPEAK